jgi:hypothetical protein
MSDMLKAILTGVRQQVKFRIDRNPFPIRAMNSCQKSSVLAQLGWQKMFSHSLGNILEELQRGECFCVSLSVGHLSLSLCWCGESVYAGGCYHHRILLLLLLCLCLGVVKGRARRFNKPWPGWK